MTWCYPKAYCLWGQIFKARSNWAECRLLLTWWCSSVTEGWKGTDQGKSGWLWPFEALHQHQGNLTLLHLALKMHDETTHKPVVWRLGQKLRRSLLDGYVELSNGAVGEQSWGFTVSRMVHRSVISVKGPFLTGLNSSRMLRLLRNSTASCVAAQPHVF